jgi:spermidine/putrescine transport system ATP-binding protein
MPLLEVQGLEKRFGAAAAVGGVSLSVEAGEFVALLGPSGCGKTTLLRCIAGLLAPDAGRILMGGDDITALPPYRRPLNTVFQNYALFPHMTVLENVAYGPRRHGATRGEAKDRAIEALALVGLEGMGERSPRQLSGGQQQRVALARAIVNRPKLLLLDEPLSALDLKLRKRMQLELKHLQAQLGIAFVFVTHDQEEALTMADRIVVMNGGRIDQIGSGPEVYRRPATRFVAEFIGEANLIPCEVERRGLLRPAIGDASAAFADAAPGRRYTAVLRPEDVDLVEGPGAAGWSTAAGVIEETVTTGAETSIFVRTGNLLVRVRRLGLIGAELMPGSPAVIGWRIADLHVVAE